jgi:hypothetical protein
LPKINELKMTYSELSINYPTDLFYATYKLQNEGGIDFGICDKLKMWKNKKGWQYGCFYDKRKTKEYKFIAKEIKK